MQHVLGQDCQAGFNQTWLSRKKTPSVDAGEGKHYTAAPGARGSSIRGDSGRRRVPATRRRSHRRWLRRGVRGGAAEAPRSPGCSTPRPAFTLTTGAATMHHSRAPSRARGVCARAPEPAPALEGRRRARLLTGMRRGSRAQRPCGPGDLGETLRIPCNLLNCTVRPIHKLRI